MRAYVFLALCAILVALPGCANAPIEHNLPFFYPEVRCDDAKIAKIRAESLAAAAEREGRTADAAKWRGRIPEHEATARRWCSGK